MITRETIPFCGWTNNLRLSNGDIELIVTLDVGPRVLSYRRTAGGPNVFKIFEGQNGGTGESEWMIRGGHRFWLAPEDPARSYLPDNDPVAPVELTDGGTRFLTAPELTFGLQKEIDVVLDPTGSGVTITHRVTNSGSSPAELALWALSAMAPGGRGIIPLPPKSPHPGHPRNASGRESFAPNQLMVGWPFLDFSDPRWSFGARTITLSQHPDRGPTKLGLAHRLGVVGYHLDDVLFIKRFSYLEGSTYPDWGCNFETFTNEDMLELESLGPLVTLKPNASVEHVERWELLPCDTAAEADEMILARV